MVKRLPFDYSEVHRVYSPCEQRDPNNNDQQRTQLSAESRQFGETYRLYVSQRCRLVSVCQA